MEQQFGKLYVVATPIGNLGDMTFRGIDTLKAVDMIACEDTRVTRKLLIHYDIATPVITYHQHTRDAASERIINEIKNGKSVALVTDAGTPGVSDPGNKLVAYAVECAIEVVAIPGPSAINAIISIAGIDMQKYIFMAYPPHKKGRQTFFRTVCESTVPVVYYESVHRILKNLQLFAEMCDNTEIIVGKELTKMYEEVVRGDVKKVIAYFEKNPDKVRGEFVVIVQR